MSCCWCQAARSVEIVLHREFSAYQIDGVPGVVLAEGGQAKGFPGLVTAERELVPAGSAALGTCPQGFKLYSQNRYQYQDQVPRSLYLSPEIEPEPRGGRFDRPG